jgi:AcrR family transcriptional regulator
MPRPQRELRILDAAEQEFARCGFAAASMETIARGSGVTKALLYQYFQSKEGLYVACVERGRARMFEVMARAARAAGPERMLSAVVDAYFDQLEAEQNSWFVLYGDAPVAAVNQMRNRNAAVIVGLLGDATSLTARDVELVAHLIVGAGEQVGRWWLDHPGVPSRRVKRKFTTAIAAAIGAVERSRS